MLKRFVVLSMTVAAGLGLGACASMNQYEDPARPVVESRETVVHVENHNWTDMTVYMVTRTGHKTRLGTVISMSKARFKVPETMMAGTGEVYLMSDPLGSSERFVSPPVMLSPGSQVEWRLENNLALSSLQVR